MATLIVPVALAGVAAYALFSKSSSAQTPSAPSSPYNPSPSAPSSGNVSPTPGGPSGGSSTTSNPADQWNPNSSTPEVFPGQTPPSVGPGDTGVFTNLPTDPGGGSAPLGPAAVQQNDPSLWDQITGLFSSGSSSGAVGAGSFPDCTLPDGSPGFFSDHPHVLAVTGGRGGYIHDYPGRCEGYAPPGGMPIF